MENNMERIKMLEAENQALREENEKLAETVGWMHDTIWKLIGKRG